MALLDPDRLFPIDAAARGLARALYDTVKDAPIVSPHGHTDPAWFAQNTPFSDPAALFVTPDHYVCRMLVSQGVPLESLGIAPKDDTKFETDPRTIWRTFAGGYHLFRATPSRLWIDHALQEVFGVTTPLTPDSADAIYDQIDAALQTPAYRPRALYERFGVTALATTDAATDPLPHHQALAQSDWSGRILPTYRPDAVVNPDDPTFLAQVALLGDQTREDTSTWSGYLAAHRTARARFIALGATATDHGHPTARTANLPTDEAATLFDTIMLGRHTPEQAELFRAQMLTEMAKMSLDDGLVMQIHAGSRRNHARHVFDRFGPDKGFDIPGRTDYVSDLQPMLQLLGMERDLTIILFTLDETTYGRELAPLAGVYPCLRLGPAWWFFDSAEGMRRFREHTTETAGFYNTVGFNDDTRALCSIPARHDVARRVDCSYLADLVLTGRLRDDEAYDLAQDLAWRLAKAAYKL